MKMEEMKAYLENNGFEVMYKRNSVRDGYDFVISKNNKHCYGWYQWPADQMSFMENLIDNFVKEFGCVEKYEPAILWPKKNPYSSMYQNGPKPKIKNVIFNDPATIVFWTDDTKTVVKCQDGDIYDPEKGLAMAITKKIFGNKGNYCNEFKKWLPKDNNNTLVDGEALKDTCNHKELIRKAYDILVDWHNNSKIQRGTYISNKILEDRENKFEELFDCLSEALGD